MNFEKRLCEGPLFFVSNDFLIICAQILILQMKNFILIYVLIIYAFCSGCATIINGDRQSISFRSKPTGATVMINDSVYGKTPLTINMRRKKKYHHVRLAMDGYQPYQTDVSRILDGWVIGNILIGGLIGLGVD